MSFTETAPRVNSDPALALPWSSEDLLPEPGEQDIFDGIDEPALVQAELSAPEPVATEPEYTPTPEAVRAQENIVQGVVTALAATYAPPPTPVQAATAQSAPEIKADPVTALTKPADLDEQIANIERKIAKMEVIDPNDEDGIIDMLRQQVSLRLRQKEVLETIALRQTHTAAMRAEYEKSRGIDPSAITAYQDAEALVERLKTQLQTAKESARALAATLKAKGVDENDESRARKAALDAYESSNASWFEGLTPDELAPGLSYKDNPFKKHRAITTSGERKTGTRRLSESAGSGASGQPITAKMFAVAIEAVRVVDGEDCYILPRDEEHAMTKTDMIRDLNASSCLVNAGVMNPGRCLRNHTDRLEKSARDNGWDMVPVDGSGAQGADFARYWFSK